MIITKVSIPEYDRLLLKHCDDRPTPKETKSIKFIMADNYDYISHLYHTNKLTDFTFKSIQMMLLCSTFYLGYVTYECPECKNYNIIPRTCKSRFCNKCGAKYAMQRAAHVSSISVDVPHRHVVFTIPKQLRAIFARDRQLLDILFIASRNTIATMTNKNYLNHLKRHHDKNNTILTRTKSPYLFKDIPLPNRFGAISTLHTFGRDLKWIPHIHMLVPEVYYDTKKDRMVPIKHFNYHQLRKTWQYQLLTLLREHIGSHLVSQLYKRYPKGFYVYAKDNPIDDEDDFDDINENTKQCLQYALRYTGRPAMSEHRITSYDPETKMVEWFFNPHENEEETIWVKEHAHDFINKLLIHIPRKDFKMIRYYGFYANAAKNLLDHVHALLKSTPHKLTKAQRRKILEEEKERLNYRRLLIESFGRDPLLCPCGAIMIYCDTYDPFDREGRRIPNDAGYRHRSIDEMLKMRIPRRSPTLGA